MLLLYFMCQYILLYRSKSKRLLRRKNQDVASQIFIGALTEVMNSSLRVIETLAACQYNQVSTQINTFLLVPLISATQMTKLTVKKMPKEHGNWLKTSVI